MTGYHPDPAFVELARPDDPADAAMAAKTLNGAPFFDVVTPAAFPKHIIRYRNDRWADAVGLAHLTDDEWARHFGRFHPLPDNLSAPLALRYHGHQFQHYNPDIGDGRGFLFAQLRDADQRLLDLATKGSGRTPYSRTADGRLTLKGAVREILATEMLEALGVYTSKTFSVIETGEALERHDEPSPTRSAVLVRLGHSHVRFGTFQRLAYEGDRDGINRLIDYCIQQFDPDLRDTPPAEKAAALFERIVARTARLAAQWMAAGFVHGVLNTDNMNVTGESFDYGPWRFAPVADFNFTAAYFDHQSIYAFGRQPDAAAWNLSRLGGAFALVAEEGPLNTALQTFAVHFDAGMTDAFFRRLGLAPPDKEQMKSASAFVMAWLEWLQASGAPFEQAFFDWFGGSVSEPRAAQSPAAAFYADDRFTPIRQQMFSFQPIAPERLNHPYFKGPNPCRMLIEDVEELWKRIAEDDDWAALSEKLDAIRFMREAYDFRVPFWTPDTPPA